MEMTSAIGDALNNPNIKGSNAEKKREEANKLAYALQGFNKGLAFLPDTILNGISGGGYLFNKDPIENLFKKTGIISDIPQAQSMGNRLVESLGNAAGGMTLPVGGAIKGAVQGGGALAQGLAKSLLGADKPVRAASELLNKTAAKTVGGTIAQGTAEPFIEDYTDNPLARILLSMGTGIAGGEALSSLLKQPAKSLPSATSAQSLFAQGKGNETRTKDLVRKQLDLTKSDPKSADLLQQIANAQEQNIYNKIPQGGKTNPSEIADKIKAFIDNFKKGRNKDYVEVEDKLFSQPNAVVNLDGVIESTDKILKRFDAQSQLRKKIEGFVERLKESKGNPYIVNSIKQEMSDAVDMGSPLYLGKKQSKILSDVASSVDNAIGESIPGYKDLLNRPYAEKTKMLEEWIDGPVGKVFNKTETAKPSDVFKTIFENTDKRLAGQLKEILPSELYSQAANEYLSDLYRLAQETPTKNAYNKFTQINAIKDKLTKNRSQLEATLPEAQYKLINEIIADIEQTSLGRPRNDFVVDSGRTISVGDEIKGLGTPLTLVKKAIGKVGGNYLNRNEMLTGESPMRQMGNSLIQPVRSLTQSGMRAGSMSSEERNPSGFISQDYIAPDTGHRNRQPKEDPFKIVMEEIRQQARNSQARGAVLPAQEKVDQSAQGDPFEQAMKEIKRNARNPLN